MTIVPLKWWALGAIGLAVLLLPGCASTYTTRQCVINIVQQVGESSFAAVLFCDQEKPHEAAK